MKNIKIDFAALTSVAYNACGFVPFEENGKIKEGYYCLPGKNAVVDLSACALDEKTILREAVKQLSNEIHNIGEEAWHNAIERDLDN